MNYQRITVEPMIFLAFAALFYYQLVRDVGVYKLFFNKHSNDSHFAQNLTDAEGATLLQNTVQKETTLWLMTCDLLAVVPSIGSNLLLSALSDVKGRKMVMILGLVGSIIGIAPFVALFGYPDDVPMWAMFPGVLICAFIGSLSIVLIASHAFLVDTVSDKDSLTFRLSLLIACVSTGQTLGTYLAGHAMLVFSSAQCMMGAVVALIITLIYCLLLVPNDKHVLVSDKPTDRNDTASYVSLGACGMPLACRKTEQLIGQIWMTFFKKRTGWNRCFLLVGVFIYFLNTIIDLNVSSLLTIYVFKDPLKWSSDQFATWKAFNSISGSLFTVAVVFVSKRWIHMHDCALTVLGLASCALQRILIGSAPILAPLATSLTPLASVYDDSSSTATTSSALISVTLSMTKGSNVVIPSFLGTNSSLDWSAAATPSNLSLIPITPLLSSSEAWSLIAKNASSSSSSSVDDVLNYSMTLSTFRQFASTNYVMYTSSVVGGLSRAVAPALGGLATRFLTESSEAGKLFGGFTVTAIFALIGATLAFNGLYSVTLAWFSGFVFFVMAAVALAAILLTFWLWWKVNRTDGLECLRDDGSNGARCGDSSSSSNKISI